MILNDVHRGIQKNKKRKRLGRGPGSGQGKTAGRGYNGQGSRSGVSKLSIFVGGMTPLVRRIPKRGFHNRFGSEVAVVNVGQLDKAFAAGEEVTLESLAAKNLAKGQFDTLKVLGNGELTKKIKINAHQFSKSAVEKIEKAGCQMVVLPGKTPVADKQRAKRQAKKG
jgi:large subunit ribosomal protein L15